VKLLTQQLYELSAKGFGLDLGVLVTPLDNLQIGLVVQDIRSGYNWNSDDIYERGSAIENRFPVTLRGGVAWRLPKYSTLLAVDVDKQTSGDVELHVGAEHIIMHRLALRAGLDGGDLAGGFGVVFPIAGLESRIDYSLANDDNDPELSQILSWVIRF